MSDGLAVASSTNITGATALVLPTLVRQLTISDLRGPLFAHPVCSLKASGAVQRKPRAISQNPEKELDFRGYKWGYLWSGVILSLLSSTDVAPWGEDQVSNLLSIIYYIYLRVLLDLSRLRDRSRKVGSRSKRCGEIRCLMRISSIQQKRFFRRIVRM
jgi:hypothetical protein